MKVIYLPGFVTGNQNRLKRFSVARQIDYPKLSRAFCVVTNSLANSVMLILFKVLWESETSGVPRLRTYDVLKSLK
jgi:hypothetical protein